MTPTLLFAKLDSYLKLINDYGNSTLSLKEINQRKNEIQENLKAIETTDAAEKEAVINKFTEINNIFATKLAAIEKDNIEFTANSIAQIEDFGKQVNASNLSKEDIVSFKKIGSTLFENFKQQRWESKDKREASWETFNNIRTLLKEKEDDFFNKLREEKTNQASQSLEIAEKLHVIITACHPETSIDELALMVQKFNEYLATLAFENDPLKWLLLAKPEEIKYPLKARSETINDVRNFINDNKDIIVREDKQNIYANIDAIKTYLNKAWDIHKHEQQLKQEQWKEQQKIREEKKNEWQGKQQDFLDMLENRLENQVEFRSKLQANIANQKDYLFKFEQRIVDQKDYILKLNDQLIDLEKKHLTAWTDTFKSKVEGWMNEKKNKIKEIEKDIAVLHQKVVDINKKIEDVPKKIQEVSDSIAEIQFKIQEVSSKLASVDNNENQNNNAANTANEVLPETKIVDVQIEPIEAAIIENNIVEKPVLQECNNEVENVENDSQEQQSN
jgi:hypothetical protein